MDTSRRPRPLLALAVLALLTALSCLTAVGAATSASASTRPGIGARMLDWAEVHAKGRPYVYGGTGPYGFDCSGTVYAAARALGITLPRTSYAMAAGSAHLTPIPLSQARRGDIVVYPGSGHVEFRTKWRHGTFGASHSGTLVGWHTWSAYYHPVFALRVR